MQDRYAGDVGDFGKFSLLRHLFGMSEDRLGIIWYLFPDESHNNDGGHTDYIEQRRFLNCDRELCEKMKAVLMDHRCVASLENAKLLPPETVFFSERLDYHQKYLSARQEDKEKRTTARQAWLRKAKQQVSECQTLFLDPDNGLEISSCSKLSQMKAGKFAYYSEVAELAYGKNLCIIYHHLNRTGTHMQQIKVRIDELRIRINPAGNIYGFRFQPYSPRAYFILTDSQSSRAVKMSLDDFFSGPCGEHWDSFQLG